MLKQILLSVIVVMFGGYTNVALADEPYDTTATIEFIKDGEVIDSRPLSAEELEQYQKIEALEVEIHQLEEPLHAFEVLMEQKAQKIEQAVESVIAQAFSSVQRDELLASKDREFQDLELLMEELEPKLDNIKAKAEQIAQVAEQFEALIFTDYNEGEIDKVRIIAQDGNINFTMDD